MILAVLSSFAQEESRSMSENNKWTIKKKFERGEIMINTERFLGYDKDEYGGLSINKKEALIVAFLYDMTLFGLGSSRLKNLMNYLGVRSITGGTWHEGTITGVLGNEKYKGDYHLQKTFTPEDKRNHSRLNCGEVQSYYIKDNHPAIVSEDLWNQVQEERECRKRERNIASDGTVKYQNRYPLSGMLVCPYCGKSLRRRQVYKKKIQWLCSTYIDEGKQACKGIRLDDAEIQKQSITEPTVIEEVEQNGKKHYCYTCKNMTVDTGNSQNVRQLRMAAYCRVSSDKKEQLLSYENQLNYYTGYINDNPLYQFAGVYADEGITGTNTKKRD